MYPVNYYDIPEIDNVNEFLDSIICRIKKLSSRKVDKPLVLYGAGNLGRMAKTFFDSLSISIRCVIDANPGIHVDNHVWKDVSIITPKEICNDDYKDCMLVICIVTLPFSELKEQLTKTGWLDIVPFYDVAEAYSDKHPLSNGWFKTSFTSDEIKNIKFVLNNWNDSISIAHHLQFIQWRSLREEAIYDGAPIDITNRFFIHEMTSVMRNDEVFVDCGAYHGEVVERFIEETHNKWKSIHVIEPDNNSFKILNKFTENKKINKYQLALSDSSGKIRFSHGYGYMSKIDNNAKDYITSSKLDDLDISATFIKMHLEGHELKALTGAMQTIINNRPMLAITVYHNSDGIWEIPYFLMNNLDNYDFTFRLHSWAGTGAVVYAIPKERRN